jgi:glycosyltransferase involved in cell wall biosynthesis
MAVYNDFDGVYFTIQALRLYQDLDDTELLVIDNYGCDDTRRFVEGTPGARYRRDTGVGGTAAPRDLVFREARGDAVLCCDAHVLFAPDAIARLKAYYRDHLDTRDLLQGPLLYDDLRSTATHFDPVWRAQMWGIWANDPRGLDPDGEPFEIPMQGLGVFSCRREAWPGFNPAFRGFGGEEGYLHEKFRQRGDRCLCLPWLRWGHRFGRPAGVPYRLSAEDKLHNYVVGHAELGLDLQPVTSHFAEVLPPETIEAVTAEALRDQKQAAMPMVSCICPTSGRPPVHQHLLEEAVESFLRQTYPNKELIVLNDCPDQELFCDAPGVRIINVAARYSSLGEKYNAAIAMARGALIAPWEDDDISLPWRLSLSVEQLGEATYFNPRSYWFWDEAGLHADHQVGYGHNLSLFTRAAFDAVGGYPPVSGAQDAAMDALLCRRDTVGAKRISPDEWFYIYRWGVSPHHLSGATNPNAWQEIGMQPVEPGQFTLRPHWRQDYGLAVRCFLAANASSASTKRKKSREGRRQRNRPTVGPLVFVTGTSATTKHPAARPFPLLEPEPGEPMARYLDRVMCAIDEAVIAGGTHLLVPRDAADWLGGHPLLVDYFAAQHELIEWSESLGFVFDLRRLP